MDNRFLTGNKDVDLMILAKLSDEDLVNVCKLNPEADKYCDDQNFWLKRIQVKFPYLDREMVIKYKGDRTWSDYYIYDLKKIGHKGNLGMEIEDAIRKGRLDQLIVLQKLGLKLNISRFIRLAELHGNKDIIQYLNFLPRYL